MVFVDNKYAELGQNHDQIQESGEITTEKETVANKTNEEPGCVDEKEDTQLKVKQVVDMFNRGQECSHGSGKGSV